MARSSEGEIRITQFQNANLVRVFQDSSETVAGLQVRAGALMETTAKNRGGFHKEEHVVLGGIEGEAIKTWRGRYLRSRGGFEAGVDHVGTEHLLGGANTKAADLTQDLLEMARSYVPRFGPEWRHHNNVLSTEILGEPDSPLDWIIDYFEAMWWNNMAIGSIRGKVADVVKMSPTTLGKIHDEFYVRENVTLTVVGDPRGADREFRQSVQLWPSGVRSEIPDLVRGKDRRVVKTWPYSLVYVMAGVPAIPLGDPRTPVLECIEAMLGLDFTVMSPSLLSQANMEYKVGAYDLDTVTNLLPGGGYLAIRGGVQPKNLKKSITMMRSVFERLERGGVGVRDLDFAKQQAVNKVTSLYGDPWALASYIGERVSMGVPVMSEKEHLVAIGKVTMSDIRKLIAEMYFDLDKQMGLAIVGPVDGDLNPVKFVIAK